MFTTYAQIENGQVVAYPVNPHAKNENGELNVPAYWLGGELDGKTYVYCHNIEPAYNYTQDIVETVPALNSEDGQWYRQYQVVSVSQEVIEKRTQERAALVQTAVQTLQAVADKALAKPLTPEQQASWQNYKTQINALLTGAEFPWGVVWPLTPDEVKPVIEVTRL